MWGFIDSTMKAICHPDENQEIYYSGCKKCHVVKYQALSIPNSLIAPLSELYTSRESDWTAYQSSGPVAKLQELELVHDPDPARRFCIYGDLAYSLSYGIICAY
ncbi:hypothetical protein C7212DRAFT_192276 [Tuber magnatum]|uniref:DDE Tnp4 domain-containing protein n=1 Tax=Tuber magnatum TaxID=42249 RepID=A0A317SQD6_9PEZI|nr:hypothetical protein C7212DRAFT_192276 [Tuber magnatum]